MRQLIFKFALLFVNTSLLSFYIKKRSTSRRATAIHDQYIYILCLFQFKGIGALMMVQYRRGPAEVCGMLCKSLLLRFKKQVENPHREITPKRLQNYMIAKTFVRVYACSIIKSATSTVVRLNYYSEEKNIFIFSPFIYNYFLRFFTKIKIS